MRITSLPTGLRRQPRIRVHALLLTLGLGSCAATAQALDYSLTPSFSNSVHWDEYISDYTPGSGWTTSLLFGNNVFGVLDLTIAAEGWEGAAELTLTFDYTLTSRLSNPIPVLRPAADYANFAGTADGLIETGVTLGHEYGSNFDLYGEPLSTSSTPATGTVMFSLLIEQPGIHTLYFEADHLLYTPSNLAVADSEAPASGITYVELSVVFSGGELISGETPAVPDHAGTNGLLLLGLLGFVATRCRCRGHLV